MNNATRLALQTRLANVFSAIRAAGAPITLANLARDMGLEFRPVWEASALVSIGAIRRVDAATAGATCVDALYVARPMREWTADISKAVEHVC